MLLLFISIAMLGLAPLIYFGASRFPRIWRLFDRLITLMVACLVVLHLLPESIRNVGFIAIPLALLGLFLPSILERVWEHGASKVHFTSVGLVLVGLAVHGMLDGAALALPELPSSGSVLGTSLLQLAVVLHRLPAALFIWSLFYPQVGGKIAGLILTFLGIGTLLGYVTADTILQHIQSEGAVVFYMQALVAGSLLHIAFDRHDHDAHTPLSYGAAPGHSHAPTDHHHHHHHHHHH